MFYRHKNGIGLRKVEHRDLADLKQLKDESWFGTVNTACLNMTDQERWFQSISGSRDSLFFILVNAERSQSGSEDCLGIYGVTDMNAVNRSCSFTHSLYKKARGKGHGLRTLIAGIDMTFEVFNQRRIETWILENNFAELKISKTVGFQVEGCKREAVYKCGEYLDCNLLGLLRSDWEISSRVSALGGLCNESYKPKCSKTQ